MTYDGRLTALVDLEIEISPNVYFPDNGPAVVTAGQQYPYHILHDDVICVYAGHPEKWVTLRDGEYKRDRMKPRATPRSLPADVRLVAFSVRRNARPPDDPGVRTQSRKEI